jgi:hypothetical protein
MKLAGLLVGLMLVASVLWLAGEKHRENCIEAGRVNCGVLPWDNGERARLSEQSCRALRRAGADEATLPPECR